MTDSRASRTFRLLRLLGPWAPGERTGVYRVSGDVALFDAEGGSNISGGDFAAAIVDEVEAPAYHRAQIGVAY